MILFNKCKTCCNGGLSPVKATDEMTQEVGQRHGQLFTIPGGGSSDNLKVGGLHLRLDDQISINQPVEIPVKFTAFRGAEVTQCSKIKISTDHKLYYDDIEVADARGFYQYDDCNIACLDDAEISVNHLMFLVQHSTVVQYFA